MARSRWIFLAGVAAVLLLVGLPIVLLLVCGWPRTGSSHAYGSALGSIAAQVVLLGHAGAYVPYQAARQSGPIAPPPPPVGLDPLLVRWLLISGALLLGLSLGAWLVALFSRQGLESPKGTPPRARAGLLFSLGAASLAAYGIHFALPFSLPGYYHLPGSSIGAIAGRDGATALATAAATVALFLLYTLAHRLCRGRGERRLWAIVLLGALLLALANFWVSCITTLDPYDYIARGRITGVHQGNPYVQAPADYPSDPFMGYVSWSTKTSAYGPLWETASGLIALLGSDSLYASMLAHKALALACYLLSVLLIAAILRRVAPQRALAGTLLFAWNPLILMEGIANAHNDMGMVVLLLAAFWFLSQVRPGVGEPGLEGRPDASLFASAVALLLLAGSILVKFVPALFLPFFLLYLVWGQQDWRRWLRGGLLLIPPVLLVVWHYLPFWTPTVLDTITRRTEMFRMTVGSVAKEALQTRIPDSQAQAAITQPFLVAFGLAYLVLLGLAVRSALEKPGSPAAARGTVSRLLLGDWDDRSPWGVLVQACLGAFLLYLLLGNFWYWPWYLLLPLALLALGAPERLYPPLILAACAGELAHLGWNFLWYWWGISWETSYEMDALVVFGMAVPALVLYVILSLRRRPAPA